MIGWWWWRACCRLWWLVQQAGRCRRDPQRISPRRSPPSAQNMLPAARNARSSRHIPCYLPSSHQHHCANIFITPLRFLLSAPVNLSSTRHPNSPPPAPSIHFVNYVTSTPPPNSCPLGRTATLIHQPTAASNLRIACLHLFYPAFFYHTHLSQSVNSSHFSDFVLLGFGACAFCNPYLTICKI